MKIWMVILFSCITTVCAFAQTVISGTITDAENNSAMEGAIIKLSDTNNQLIAYTTSLANGNYCLKFVSSHSTHLLSVSFLGYKTMVVEIANQNCVKNFSLQTDAIMLHEVHVKPPAISKVGDTLTYNVDRFKLEQDRSISDVLRKMPGIEVSEAGSISYQGKPISKFYIEGLDLLGRKYSLASNSIPSDAISSVQIYENHQPVKALNGLANSDRAALNLILKDKHRIKPVGYIEGGLGGMKDELLWSADFFSLFVSSKKQSLFSYKSNNTGNLLFNMQEEQGINVEDIEKGIPTNPENLFPGISFTELPVTSGRYKFNQSHLLNYNRLWKQNEIQWRVTASYLNENNKQRIYTENDYFLPGDEHYLTFEDNTGRIKENKGTLGVALELNTQKLYISNSTDMYADWQNVNSDISSNTSADFQSFEMPTYEIHNNLSIVKRLKKNALSFYSYIRYTNQPQKLTVQTSEESMGLICQDAKHAMFYTINGTDYSFSYLNSLFSLGLKFQASSGTYRTRNDNLYIASAGYSPNNRLSDDKYSIRLYPQYNYTLDRMKLKISSPLSYTYYVCNNRETDTSKDLRDWTFEPSLLLRFDITGYWNASVNYSHRKQFGNILDFADAPVMKDYQSSQMGSGILEERVSDTYGIQLAYRNQIDALFFHLSAIYRPMNVNTIHGNKFMNSHILTYRMMQSNDRNMKIFTSSFAKFIDCLHTNLSVTTGYTQTKSSLYQQQQLYPLEVETYRVITKIDSKLTSWLNMEAQIQWNRSLLNDKKNPKRKTESIRPNIAGYIIPAKSMYLSLSAEYSYKKSSTGNSTHYLFTDAKVNYRKEDWEITLLCQNIFNYDLYEDTYYSELTSSYMSFPMRGANVLMSVRYNF